MGIVWVGGKGVLGKMPLAMSSSSVWALAEQGRQRRKMYRKEDVFIDVS
jgi:hypothetical protein